MTAIQSTNAPAPAPPDAPPPRRSVSELFASAAKKTKIGRPPSGYLWDGAPAQPADTLLKSRAAKETKEEYDLARLQLIELVTPWYAQQVRQFGYQASVRMICGVGPGGESQECRLSFQNRYSKVPLDRAPALRSIVGDARFDTFFKTMRGLKIKKEVAEDPERLATALELMLSGAIGEHFATYFESEEFLYPRVLFTERRWIDLSDEQNAQCAAQGVTQTVTFSDSTKDD